MQTNSTPGAALRLAEPAVLAARSFRKQNQRVSFPQHGKDFLERADVAPAVAVHGNDVAVRQDEPQQRIVHQRFPREKIHFPRNRATDERRVEKTHVVARDEKTAFRQVFHAAHLHAPEDVHERPRDVMEESVNFFVGAKFHRRFLAGAFPRKLFTARKSWR